MTLSTFTAGQGLQKEPLPLACNKFHPTFRFPEVAPERKLSSPRPCSLMDKVRPISETCCTNVRETSWAKAWQSGNFCTKLGPLAWTREGGGRERCEKRDEGREGEREGRRGGMER